ncbi:MAG: hypothetical protein R2685_11080 [Candidatus Nitrosocosmicus sp.]|nr:hypothetical protein [Candidatus Nitrosocosmicus sp.]
MSFKCPNCGECDFSINIHRHTEQALNEFHYPIGFRDLGRGIESKCNICGQDLGVNNIEVKDGKVNLS